MHILEYFGKLVRWLFLLLVLWIIWRVVQGIFGIGTGADRIAYLDESGKEITSVPSLMYSNAKSIVVDGKLYETRFGKEYRLKSLLHDVHSFYSVEDLKSGKLFICGMDQCYPDAPNSDAAETSLYDVKSACASAGPRLNVARCIPSLLLLRDGRVLIVGGMNPDGVSTSDAVEVYNPESNKVAMLGRLNEARGGAGCIQLSEDKVAVIGGQLKYHPSGLIQTVTGTCEVLDLKTGQAKRAGSVFPCTEPTLVKDKQGNILVIGGYYLTRVMGDTRWKKGLDVFSP